MKTILQSVFSITYGIPHGNEFKLVEADDFKEAIDIFHAHYTEDTYKIKEVKKCEYTIIKPLTETVTVEL